MKQLSNASIKVKDGSGNWNIVPGIAGESAYEIAVRRGYQGTEAQWLNALETERAAAVNDIQTAKANALSDIPQSYQELNNSVDDFKDNLVLIQDSQPNAEDNKLWIDSDDTAEVTVPTYAEFSQLSEELGNLENGTNVYVKKALANSRWPRVYLPVENGHSYYIRVLEVISDNDYDRVVVADANGNITSSIDMGKIYTFNVTDNASTVVLSNRYSAAPSDTPIFVYELADTNDKTSRLYMGPNAEKTNQSLMRPLVVLSGEPSCASAYANAIQSMWFEFETKEDEDAFWNGQHTFGAVTTSGRNIGLSYVPDGATLRFYWFSDGGRYITSDVAFNIVETQNVYCVMPGLNNICYHKVTVTLDTYNITVHIIVDWTAVQATADTTVFNARFSKEYNRLYGALLTLKTGYNLWPSPIKNANTAENRRPIEQDIIAATKGVLFEFESQAEEDAFWGGTHTYESTTATRGLGPCVYAVTNGIKNISWYWTDDTGHYIPHDLAFVCKEGESVLYKIGGITVHRFTGSLDGFACKIYIAINWNEIAPAETAANGLIYDKNAIPYQKLIFAFSGVVGIIGGNGLQDVNFGVDGDSITAGNQWSYIAANKLGYKTHHNVAVGSARLQDKLVTYNGTTYYPQIYGQDGWLGISDGYAEIADATEAQKRANNCAKNHVLKFIAEVDSGAYPEPDVFVFALGTNDAAGRVGTIEDAFASSTPLDVDDPLLETSVGAMRWCVQKIKTEYPNCKILWSTPIQSTDDARNSGNDTKVPILTEAAKLLSVQIIDQRNNSGISAIMEKANPHYLRDGIHPTDDGKAVMAQCAISVLANIMKQ